MACGHHDGGAGRPAPAGSSTPAGGCCDGRRRPPSALLPYLQGMRCPRGPGSVYIELDELEKLHGSMSVYHYGSHYPGFLARSLSRWTGGTCASTFMRLHLSDPIGSEDLARLRVTVLLNLMPELSSRLTESLNGK